MEYFIKVPNANYFVKVIAENEAEARKIFINRAYKTRQRLPNGTIVMDSIPLIPGSSVPEMCFDLPL